MAIWALADLHLAIGVPEKNMGIFGPLWEGYMEKMEQAWRKKISPEDLVLIPGDISWAMQLEEVRLDLAWIDNLPGTKLLLRGNHDYWWSSSTKLRQIMPPSIHFIHNTAWNWNGVSIGGARLWDTEEYRFQQIIHFQKSPFEPKEMERKGSIEEDRKIFHRELARLRLSLSQLDPQAKRRIAMTHYPPISIDLSPSLASAILEEFNIEICVFGHLHNVKKGIPLFGESRGVHYVLASSDYLDFIPRLLIK